VEAWAAPLGSKPRGRAPALKPCKRAPDLVLWMVKRVGEGFLGKRGPAERRFVWTVMPVYPRKKLQGFEYFRWAKR
jgi:hypothetical protein